jgi:hypothetical protein
MRRLLLLAAGLLLPASCSGTSPGATASPTASPTAASPSAIASPSPQIQQLTVNAGGGSSSLPASWHFQVLYPSTYFVTDDDMLVGFNSQGGIAPPRLSFTKGAQLMALNPNVFQFLQEGDRDCILIWSTLGFSSISDWEHIIWPDNPTTVVSEHTQQLGTFTFVIRELAPRGASAHSFEAFVQLPQNLSYFFDTCNANTQADMLAMLQTFRVRAQ